MTSITRVVGEVRSVSSAPWAAIFCGGASATPLRTWASRSADGAHQYTPFSFKPSNVPNDIQNTTGHHLLSTAGASLAYDTRNSVRLPNKGQRTELIAQLTGGPLGGSYSFYRLELHSARYFPGLLPGHVLELGGRAGVVQEFDDAPDVPFFERYYLGGLYSLRGFKYRYISPRQVPNIPENEPIGGDTYWFGFSGIQHPHLRAGARRRGAFRLVL